MPLRNGKPVRFTPKGLSDAFDATDAFPGACRSLQNLVFDPSNPELVVCRPGVVQLTNFSGFTSPTFVSVSLALGNVVYGMVSSGRFAGHDEPFAYDVQAGTFTTISNVTSASTPTSPATSGAWTPPTMTVVGTRIIVTHPGFGGVATTVAGAAISTATNSTTTASITTSTPHGLVTGQVVTVSGMTPAAYNGTYRIVVTSTTTFSYTMASNPGGPGTAIGSYVVVSGNYFGVIDISTPASPVWYSTQLDTNPLPTVPTSVSNFNNRAYFACSNVVYYSDVLAPMTRTSASQSITVGDTTPVVAQAGLPVQTSSSGVAQALLIFKQFQIWQVTGDSTFNSLAINYLSLNVGTQAPRSVVSTPYGTIFVAFDGPYVVDSLGSVRPLTRAANKGETQDLEQPFINATTPSRISAGYSGGIYRVCVDTTAYGISQRNEYWFDNNRRRWNGPHSWPQDQCVQVGNYFVMSHSSTGASLFKSEITQSLTSVYADNGAPINFVMESCTFPKDGSMTEKSVVESTLEASTSGPALSYSVSALDDQRNILDSVQFNVAGNTNVWGSFIWGGALWSSQINTPRVYTVPWDKPLVFQKMALLISGTSQNNASIGTFYARYQVLGYTNMG